MESYAIVKGGNDLLIPASNGLLKGLKKSEFGFEALTAHAQSTRKEFGDQVVLEQATLEDIMFFSKREAEHV